MKRKSVGPSALAIRHVEIFRGLETEELASVASRMTWREYAPREQILGYLEHTMDVHFVCTGKVRSTIYAACGKEVSFEGLGPGKMFGELAAIDGRPRATHVVALASSRVASLRRGEFRELLSRYPRINEEVLLRTTEMVRSLCDRVLEFSTLGVRNRVQAELLRLARDHVHDNRAVVEPLPRHSDIAASVSTHREAVTRELGELERAGVVRRERCRLVVLDVARLERMVRDVLGR